MITHEKIYNLIKNHRLGDKVEFIINLITFGQSKHITKLMNSLFGLDDCGCDKRKNFLNNLFLKEEDKFIDL